MSTATENWKKLTVPQLRTLCKDKKITGYSKLGKGAIIQKLVEHASSLNLNTVGSTSAVVVSSPGLVASSQVSLTSTTSSAIALDLQLVPEQHVGTSEQCIIQDQILPSGKPQNTSPREPTKSFTKSTNNNSAGKYIYTRGLLEQAKLRFYVPQQTFP
jgi:hypothetical protein